MVLDQYPRNPSALLLLLFVFRNAVWSMSDAPPPVLGGCSSTAQHSTEDQIMMGVLDGWLGR